jgi:hypothetical protein
MHALTFNPYRSMHADAFDCAPKFRSDRLPSLLFTALRWLLGAMPMALLRRRCRLYALYATRFTLYATNSRFYATRLTLYATRRTLYATNSRCLRQTHVVCVLQLVAPIAAADFRLALGHVIRFRVRVQVLRALMGTLGYLDTPCKSGSSRFAMAIVVWSQSLLTPHDWIECTPDCRPPRTTRIAT